MAALGEILERNRSAPFSYAKIGATLSEPPQGYAVDHTRVCLGEGLATFEAAKASLRDWRHFELGWVEVRPSKPPLKTGREVLVLARVLGLWWVNPCRIVAVVDEPLRFGFVYGTLPEHAESGEERFLVELDPADNRVHYDILAFSRPRHPLVRLAYPLTRLIQRRFARDSAAAMQRIV